MEQDGIKLLVRMEKSRFMKKTDQGILFVKMQNQLTGQQPTFIKQVAQKLIPRSDWGAINSGK